MDRIELYFILFLLVVGVIYIYLASSTPVLGEDEPIYYELAKTMSENRYPSYSDYGWKTNHSPFIPLLMSFSFLLFGSSMSLGKIIVCIFGILTIFVVYLIGKRKGKIAGIISAMLLLTIPFFTHSMFLLYLEIPIAFFSALAFYIFLSLDTKLKAVLLGVIIGLSTYVKSSGTFLIAALFLYAMIKYILKRDKRLFQLVFLAGIMTLLIIMPLVVRNLILFDTPYVEGVSYIFPAPKSTNPDWLTAAGKAISPSINYQFYIGTEILFFGVMGLIYAFYTKKKMIFLSSFVVALFFLVFWVRTSTGGGEPRYVSIIYPQLALIGGVYLGKIPKKIKNKAVYAVLGLILVWSFWVSFNSGLGTQSSVRYSSEYIKSLEWIKRNTPEDSVIFTALTGSVIYYAERLNFWSKMDEFPQLMRTQNATFIRETLNKYNVTHVLVYGGIVAEDYIVPESNFLGLFTYNFVNVLNSNTTMFKPVFSNQETVVYEINYEEA